MLVTAERGGHDPDMNMFSPGASPHAVSGELTRRGCLPGRDAGGRSKEEKDANWKDRIGGEKG